MNHLSAIAGFVSIVAALLPAAALSQAQGAGSDEAPRVRQVIEPRIPPNFRAQGTAGDGVLVARQVVEPKLPRVSVQRGRSKADTRGCLELATNIDIIRCTEKYR